MGMRWGGCALVLKTVDGRLLLWHSRAVSLFLKKEDVYSRPSTYNRSAAPARRVPCEFADVRCAIVGHSRQLGVVDVKTEERPLPCSHAAYEVASES